MTVALPATTFATDSATMKAAPANMNTRREDDINRGHCTGAPRRRATKRMLSGLHRRVCELAQRRDAPRDDDRPLVGGGVAKPVGRRDAQRVRAIVQILRLEGPGPRLRAALVAR